MSEKNAPEKKEKEKCSPRHRGAAEGRQRGDHEDRSGQSGAEKLGEMLDNGRKRVRLVLQRADGCPGRTWIWNAEQMERIYDVLEANMRHRRLPGKTICRT